MVTSRRKQKMQGFARHADMDELSVIASGLGSHKSLSLIPMRRLTVSSGHRRPIERFAMPPGTLLERSRPKA